MYIRACLYCGVIKMLSLSFRCCCNRSTPPIPRSISILNLVSRYSSSSIISGRILGGIFGSLEIHHFPDATRQERARVQLLMHRQCDPVGGTPHPRTHPGLVLHGISMRGKRVGRIQVPRSRTIRSARC